MTRPPRRIRSASSYRALSARQRSGFNRDLDILDEKDLHPERSLTSILKSHHRDPRSFKRNVPTRKIGQRLQLAPPGKRRLYRGPITMLADINGQPVLVRLTPSNDAGRKVIEGHDAAVFAAVNDDDDTKLRRYARRVVVDSETDQRFRPYVDGEGIREATDTGALELADLYYSGGRRHDLDSAPEGSSLEEPSA
jgi:hypothetical protein